MTGCKLRQGALDRRLDTAQKRAFHDHLSSCDDCQEAMAAWETSRAALSDFIDGASPDPSGAGQARLMAAANKAPMSPLAWGFAGAVVAAGAALVLVLLLVGDPPQETAIPSPIAYELVYPKGETPARSMAPNGVLQGDGRVFRFGNTRVGLGQSATVAVAHSDKELNRFRLEQGIVAAELPHVEGREQVEVQVGPYTVRVTGTRFWVEKSDNDAVTVGVVRGAVRVTDDSNEWAVNEGEKLHLGRGGQSQPVEDTETVRTHTLLDPAYIAPAPPEIAAPPETAPTAPAVAETGTHTARRKVAPAKQSAPVPLAHIRAWVLEGRYAHAHRALQHRLANNGNDPEALDLQATCFRKEGRYADAAAVYEKLATLGAESARNRARYKLGVIYQQNLGNHQRASAHLQRYLQTPARARPNTPEVRLRLATSLKALGQRARYRQVLQEIVTHHPGTTAAARAGQLLEQAP